MGRLHDDTVRIPDENDWGCEGGARMKADILVSRFLGYEALAAVLKL